jgi:hypothetical protein
MGLRTKCAVDNIVYSWFSIGSGSIDKSAGKMTDGVKGSENDSETGNGDVELLRQVPVDESRDVVPSSKKG